MGKVPAHPSTLLLLLLLSPGSAPLHREPGHQQEQQGGTSHSLPTGEEAALGWEGPSALCLLTLRSSSVGGTSRARAWAAVVGVKAASLGLVVGAVGEGQDATDPAAFIQLLKQCLALQLSPHHAPFPAPPWGSKVPVGLLWGLEGFCRCLPGVITRCCPKGAPLPGALESWGCVASSAEKCVHMLQVS